MSSFLKRFFCNYTCYSSINSKLINTKVITFFKKLHKELSLNKHSGVTNGKFQNILCLQLDYYVSDILDDHCFSRIIESQLDQENKLTLSIVIDVFDQDEDITYHHHLNVTIKKGFMSVEANLSRELTDVLTNQVVGSLASLIQAIHLGQIK